MKDSLNPMKNNINNVNITNEEINEDIKKRKTIKYLYEIIKKDKYIPYKKNMRVLSENTEFLKEEDKKTILEIFNKHTTSESIKEKEKTYADIRDKFLNNILVKGNYNAFILTMDEFVKPFSKDLCDIVVQTVQKFKFKEYLLSLTRILAETKDILKKYGFKINDINYIKYLLLERWITAEINYNENIYDEEFKKNLSWINTSILAIVLNKIPNVIKVGSIIGKKMITSPVSIFLADYITKKFVDNDNDKDKTKKYFVTNSSFIYMIIKMILSKEYMDDEVLKINYTNDIDFKKYIDNMKKNILKYDFDESMKDSEKETLGGENEIFRSEKQEKQLSLGDGELIRELYNNIVYTFKSNYFYDEIDLVETTEEGIKYDYISNENVRHIANRKGDSNHLIRAIKILNKVVPIFYMSRRFWGVLTAPVFFFSTAKEYIYKEIKYNFLYMIEKIYEIMMKFMSVDEIFYIKYLIYENTFADCEYKINTIYSIKELIEKLKKDDKWNEKLEIAKYVIDNEEYKDKRYTSRGEKIYIERRNNENFKHYLDTMLENAEKNIKENIEQNKETEYIELTDEEKQKLGETIKQ